MFPSAEGFRRKAWQEWKMHQSFSGRGSTSLARIAKDQTPRGSHSKKRAKNRPKEHVVVVEGDDV
jgi:hypothetical protein